MNDKPRTPTAHIIMVRLSEQEKRAIERAARKAGRKFPAQWARDVLLAALPS